MHPDGAPCWVEVSTTDLDGSIGFYTQLFGWEAERLGEEAGHYTMFRSGGKAVAAATPSQSGADFWMVYLAGDADAVTERVRSAGGTVVAEPFDVFTAGRMAVFQDPQGAFFSVWQAGDMPGAELRDAPVSLSWNECQTPDRKAATAFYTAVFGYDTEDADMGGGQSYRLLKVGERPVAGMMEIQPEWGEVPPNWSTVFEVADPDATAEKARELGGQVLNEPADIPGVGRFAVLQDPAGAVFQVIRSAAT